MATSAKRKFDAFKPSPSTKQIIRGRQYWGKWAKGGEILLDTEGTDFLRCQGETQAVKRVASHYRKQIKAGKASIFICGDYAKLLIDLSEYRQEN